MRRIFVAVALALPCALPAQGRDCTDPNASMVELGACLDSTYARADRELNTAYQAALAAIRDGTQHAALVKAQRAWIAFRDAEEALWFTDADGNHPSMEVLPTKIAFTRGRTAFLRGILTSGPIRSEPGAVSDPLAPTPSVPKVKPMDERLLVAAMKSDLRNLVTAEEAFFADSIRYTTDFGQLHFQPSAGNTSPRITLVGQGWLGVIGNPRTPTTCVIFVGTAPRAPATAEGAPACQ